MGSFALLFVAISVDFSLFRSIFGIFLPTTPLVTWIAVVGYLELHASLLRHLHSEQPPINTLALPNIL